MIRVVFYLVAIGALAVVAVWFADRPGEVSITWLGERIETSVDVLAIGIGLLALLAVGLALLLQVPAVLRQRARTRLARRGYLALSRGLIAVGSGDTRAARRFAEEANRLAPGEPLALLLGAQSAQLAGDRTAAERTFKAMTQRQDTRQLGLHGLFIEAQRRHDGAAARHIAEEAARDTAAPAWAGLAVLEFRCAAADWNGALERLEANQRSGFLDKQAYARQRAVLLTARALAVEPTDRVGARALALGAVKLAPTLVPAAALAGRLLGEAGELRQAARIIEAAWSVNPHPDLADTYAHLRPGDSARDRLARVQTLVQKSSGRTGPGKTEGANIEAKLAVAQAALDAREFTIARNALEPLAAAATQRVAVLFAHLEELEHGDEGRAREWMGRALRARRDPAWTADGFVSDHWLPVSPVTGRLDAFVWMEPLAQIGNSAGERDDVIEAPAGHAPAVIEPPAALAPATPAMQNASEISSGPPPPPSSPSPDLAPNCSRLDGSPATVHSARAHQPPAPRVDAVIPLMHAPDDPGPEGEPQAEPMPAVPPPSANGWGRLFALFK